MTLKLYSAPATEPLTVAEVLLRCRIDQQNQELAPSAPTVALVSPAAAGNLTAGVYRYRLTFVTADGETEAGTISAAATVANPAVNGRVQLTAIPLGGSLVTARKIYRTAAGGSDYLLVATVNDNTTTSYTDNVADGSLGAGAPTSNTTTDPHLTSLIKSARLAAERELNRYLVTQTVDAYFDAFPGWRDDYVIRLPPLQSVESVTYFDEEGVEQTLSASRYQVDAVSVPARIMPAYGDNWPTTREQLNPVKVRFVAGYGTAAEVPECIKQWMLLQIKHAYDNPQPVVVGTISSEFPRMYVEGLLDSERVYGL